MLAYTRAVIVAAVIVIAGALAIWGKRPERLLVHWIAKPVPVLALLVTTAVQPTSLPPAAHVALLAALALSLGGDVFLMFTPRLFVFGLVSFLLAHMAFITCFTLEVPWTPSQLGWLAAPALAAMLVVRNLWPSLGTLRVAAALYGVALALVAWRLLARYDAIGDVGLGSWALGAAGAALFVLSDSVLARRRFAHQAVPYTVELGSYFAAQWCIAAATWRL